MLKIIVFEKVNKIHKPSARLSKKKEKTQITTKRNERREITHHYKLYGH